MNQAEIVNWINKNAKSFDSEYEKLFAKNVFPLVNDINLQEIKIQHPFRDVHNKQRYCDFFLNKHGSCIAIEIDGYDKRGTGEGMTHDEFVDWQRRQASLSSMGWHVIRFANRDVRDNPELCASLLNGLISNVLKNKPKINEKTYVPQEKFIAPVVTDVPKNTIASPEKLALISIKNEPINPWYQSKWIFYTFIAVVFYVIIIFKINDAEDSKSASQKFNAPQQQVTEKVVQQITQQPTKQEKINYQKHLVSEEEYKRIFNQGHTNNKIAHMVGGRIPKNAKYRGFLLNRVPKQEDLLVASGYFSDAEKIYDEKSSILESPEDYDAAHNLGVIYSKGLNGVIDNEIALAYFELSNSSPFRKWSADGPDIIKLQNLIEGKK